MEDKSPKWPMYRKIKKQAVTGKKSLDAKAKTYGWTQNALFVLLINQYLKGQIEIKLSIVINHSLLNQPTYVTIHPKEFITERLYNRVNYIFASEF